MMPSFVVQASKRPPIPTTLALISLLLLAACGPATASPPTPDLAATESPSATITASTTPSATPSQTDTATETMTETVSPTLVLVATATATSLATATPTASPRATSPASPTAPLHAAATSTPLRTATPTPSGGHTVTLADDGGTLVLHSGESFLLDLGETFTWNVTVADPTVVSRVVNILVIRGAQGVYVAHRPGQTTLTAVGEPACQQAHPVCLMPARAFKLTIVVQ